MSMRLLMLYVVDIVIQSVEGSGLPWWEEIVEMIIPGSEMVLRHKGHMAPTLVSTRNVVPCASSLSNISLYH